MVLRYVFEYTMQQTYFKRTVIGNADMMLAAAQGRELNV